MGTRHLYWILIGPSFAVEEGSGTVKMAGDRDVTVICGSQAGRNYVRPRGRKE
jgi:hypothetical protein